MNYRDLFKFNSPSGKLIINQVRRENNTASESHPTIDKLLFASIRPVRRCRFRDYARRLNRPDGTANGKNERGRRTRVGFVLRAAPRIRFVKICVSLLTASKTSSDVSRLLDRETGVSLRATPDTRNRNDDLSRVSFADFFSFGSAHRCSGRIEHGAGKDGRRNGRRGNPKRPTALSDGGWKKKKTPTVLSHVPSRLSGTDCRFRPNSCSNRIHAPRT